MGSTATNLLKLLPMRLCCQGPPPLGGGRMFIDNCIIIARGLQQQQQSLLHRARLHLQVNREQMRV